MIKLIAADMDGTLLDSNKNMPPEFPAWVKAHRDIKTVIASGRQYYNLEKLFFSLRDELTFIAENGAVVFDKGEMIYINPMNPNFVSEILGRVSLYPEIVPILCGAASAYMRRSGETAEKNAAMYYERLEFTEDLDSCISRDKIVKIALFIDGAAARFMSCFDELPDDLRAVLSGDSWIDIMNSSVNKGSAIRAVQRNFGISPDECMAFGDYLNDCELLAACSESYAMENAHPDLKKISAHIAPSNDDNGVMRILSQIR